VAGPATSASCARRCAQARPLPASSPGRPIRSAPIPPELAEALDALTLAARPELAQLAADLAAGLGPELPALARDGGYVADGYRPELDAARALRDDSRRVVAALEARLQGETGLPLRIRHNAVLGYFLETSTKQAESLLRPPLNTSFIHRQTMANQVRFTTVELAELDARIARRATGRSRSKWRPSNLP
jgi:DNA mismatch repair protein MutS